MLLPVIVIESRTSNCEPDHDYEHQHDQELKREQSYDDFQSVARDLNSGLLHMCAFPGAGHKDGVRIVYVRINLAVRWRLVQEIEAAVADRQMIHLARGAGAGPDSGQLAVAPERAIEQNDIGLMNCIPQFVG